LSWGRSNSIYISGDAPDISRPGHSYTISGCNPPLQVHERVLETTWSGRLMISKYKEQNYMLVRYLHKDIRKYVRYMWSWIPSPYIRRSRRVVES
jgi:hypothetical protein